MNNHIVDIKIKDSKQNHLVIIDHMKNLTIPETIAYLKFKYGYETIKPHKLNNLFKKLNMEEEKFKKELIM